MDIPSLDEVPVRLKPFPWTLAKGPLWTWRSTSTQESETDDFYTLTGTATGEVSVSVPIVGSVSCELTGRFATGQLTPESATTVTVSLTISNPEVTQAVLPM